MKRLLIYLRTYKLFLSIAVLAMLTAIGLDMVTPRLAKKLIDDVIIGGNLGLLHSLLLGIMIISISRAILGYTKEYLFDYTGQKVVEELRRDLFDHLQSLSFTFFDGVNTGELMSRLKEDVDNIFNTLCYGAMLFAEQVIYFLVAGVLLFMVNWKLTLIALAIMPPIGYLAVKVEKQIGVVYGKISDQGVRINTTAQENLAGVRLVKAFGREKYEIQKFLAENKKNYHLKIKQAMIWRKYFPAIEFLTNLVVVLVITFGGLLVISGEISLGTLFAFNYYIGMLVWPMRMIGWLTNMLAECRASAKKIEELFAEQPTVENPPYPLVPANISGALVFDDVSFEHNGSRILNNISLQAKPGSTIAIMGMTGAGKSSLINLIARYYDCTSGRILLDGIDVKKLPLRLLREQISLVMQDTFLFSDTIENNLRFGTEEASEEEIIQALKDAAIYDFIQELPEGRQTIIGERGIGLSGGQKQRLTIARALLKRSKILILDDATSNLDMETEYQIQQALKRRRGITKFIIAHRISAVRDADEILLIDQGKVVERGTHHQLLALKRRYYEIFQVQCGGLQSKMEEDVS